MHVESNCSSYPLHCVQLIFFLLQHCAGISPLEIWTSAKVLICGWLFMMLFCRGFQASQGQEGLESSKGHCRVHIQDWGLYAYYLTHRGQDSFQVPWHMVLDPTALTKAGCQIVIFGASYLAIWLRYSKTHECYFNGSSSWRKQWGGE